jgi:hypothetical protein
MKTYFIKIDLRTIKKNPNADSICKYVQGPPEVSFKSNGFPSFLKEGMDYIITEWSFIPEYTKYEGVMQGTLTDEQIEEIEKWVKEDPSRFFEISIKIPHIDVTTQPGPEYFYDYLNVKVKCKFCKTYHMIDDLRTVWDDDGECYSDRVCPSCKEWNCCDVEHETIEDALKRKNGKYESI